MLQSLKDAVIANGLEGTLRPLWNLVTLKRPDPYDVQAFDLIKRLPKNGVCIDVGAHKGLILDKCIRQCPDGWFIAFEPIPQMAALLRRKYHADKRVTVHELALSADNQPTTFYIDTTFPGRSSLNARDSAAVAEVSVRCARLDDLAQNVTPHIIKIDVEGAELSVLQGAQETLGRTKPLVIFEHGLGGADHFGTRPEQVYDVLAGCGLRVSLMRDLLDGKPELSREDFVRQFDQHLNYYFAAHP